MEVTETETEGIPRPADALAYQYEYQKERVIKDITEGMQEGARKIETYYSILPQLLSKLIQLGYIVKQTENGWEIRW